MPHDVTLLRDIALGIVFAAILGHVARLLRQPLLLGYIAGGILLSSRMGFGLVTSAVNIELIAEIGLILLLFIIGLEIDLRELRRLGRSMLVLGVGQFVINSLLGLAFFGWLGYRVAAGRFDLVYLAIVISLSSTLIVVKLLREKFELKILSGRLTLGVLVVQDIWAILFMAVQPSLAEPGVLFRHAGALPVVAILTLAIGIGGVTAMFTIVNRVVLNPLPFKAQDRLVLIWGSKPQDNQPELPFSQPDFDDLRAQARAFDAIGGWAPGRGNLTGSGDAEQVQWAVVTASLFDVLGVSPAIGRAFRAQEDRPGTPPIVVISHALWQRRFQSAPDIVGRTLVLDNRAMEIVGVLPADFSFLTFPSKTDVWMPLGADPFDGRRFARGARSMGVLGRLRPGVGLTEARAEADTIAAGLATAYPFFNTGRRFALVPLGEQVARDVRSGALALFGAVACVLFIACANVSSLMLARATGQHRDLLIRAALGASRWRLVRLQLAESLLLSTAGGAGGLLLAVWLVDVLVRLPYRSDSLYVPYAVARETIGRRSRRARLHDGGDRRQRDPLQPGARSPPAAATPSRCAARRHAHDRRSSAASAAGAARRRRSRTGASSCSSPPV